MLILHIFDGGSFRMLLLDCWDEEDERKQMNLKNNKNCPGMC